MHARRFPEQHLERQIDRFVFESRIFEDETLFFRRLADHREGGAFALAELSEGREPCGGDREHVTFLRLVAPDFERAHSWLSVRDRSQVEATSAAAVVHELG